MENQSKTAYSFTHRLKSETRLELFNKYYLQVSEKKLKRARDFKLELAILNQKPLHVQESALHWLAAASIVGLSNLYFFYLLFSAPDFDNLWTILAAIATATLLSVIFGLLFVFASERKWVFETRAALYPLVEIPYRKKDREQAKRFVQTLQSAIAKNISEKGYNNEILFAGEMRMLRRLAKNQILSSDTYDRAKKHMLENSGHMGVAT